MIPHVLVIYADPPGPDQLGPPHADDLDWRIECPGVTPSCQAWQECIDPACCPHVGDHIDLQGETEHHGVEHQRIDGCVMVPTGRCLTAMLDVEVSPDEWTLGEHPVDVECEEGTVYLHAIKDPS